MFVRLFAHFQQKMTDDCRMSFFHRLYSWWKKKLNISLALSLKDMNKFVKYYRNKKWKLTPSILLSISSKLSSLNLASLWTFSASRCSLSSLKQYFAWKIKKLQSFFFMHNKTFVFLGTWQQWNHHAKLLFSWLIVTFSCRFCSFVTSENKSKLIEIKLKETI